MRFLKNDIIRYKEPPIRLRVLSFYPERESVYVIDIDFPKANPELRTVEVLCEDLDGGLSILEGQDHQSRLYFEEKIPQRHKDIRDRFWIVIQDLIVDEHSIFHARTRPKLIAKAMERHGVTNKQVYQALRRYWQRGQTKNCLLPDYENSGGKGKERIAPPGAKKRGRKRKFDPLPGVNATLEIRRIFQIGEDRYKNNGKRFSLKRAYECMCSDFFMENKARPEDGRADHSYLAPYDSEGVPSFAQFRYWYEEKNNQQRARRTRLTSRVYDLSKRGLLGTATAEVWGPGARFLIDATIADVYLVSRIDGKKIIGRPVLYVVIDVFSRMIVGIYVGIENPSWVAAMMALANVVANKQQFCKSFGISITPDEWQCEHLPAIILGDRGEIESTLIDMLVSNFNVTVENAAAYRADWKSIVEQRFRLLPVIFAPYVPGYIQTDYRERGGTDYRLDAKLNLDDFTKIIIECVLLYNNHTALSEYDKDEDIAAAAIPYVPKYLWEWGVANRSGCLRRYPADKVRFSLMPVVEAVVTQYGIRAFGRYYSCAKAEEDLWFDRARQNGTWPVKCSYDPRENDYIYLHDEFNALAFFPCTLVDRSRDARGFSAWESDAQDNQQKTIHATHAVEYQKALANTVENIESIVRNAEERQPDTDTRSNAARVADIRGNRAAEKQARRPNEIFTFGQPDAVPQQKADVIPINRASQSDYSEPSITDMLGDDDDE